MVKIDKGIPLAPKSKTGPSCKYPWHDMEVDESFFVPFTENEQGHGLVAAPNKNYAPKKFAARKWKENGNDGTRIWRIN